ncbi:MAG: ACT domain-containing protein [Trueperella sp.]|nr:ACT domain-containing protein [Trueperella sp.]
MTDTYGGLTALPEILQSMSVLRRGRWVYAVLDPVPTEVELLASIREAEGLTAIISADDAKLLGLDDRPVFECLTLAVHSSLESVGLTAAVSRALADAGISCNILAGFYHDHLLVPEDQAGDAVDVLASLTREAKTGVRD